MMRIGVMLLAIVALTVDAEAHRRSVSYSSWTIGSAGAHVELELVPRGQPLHEAWRREEQVAPLAERDDRERLLALMRAVAEDVDLRNAEFNRAFVLMQYFGYLRRNPNDPQDSDYTGYDFWLTKLNQFGGNYINAEMVKAILTSIEYRQRFGP